ncbi:MAG TPA: N-acetylmuramoyl-L-alanine amidase [Lichenihabitans sp.]|jgi:N-acetylmuramoyl-L-alanine amidase|nr:N-acetylmuramoyl-L-alanine amidase [Lichenihabitans sp.]
MLILGLSFGGVQSAAARPAAGSSALPPEAALLRIGEGGDGPVAVAARATQVGGVTRLSVDLSRSVPIKAFVLDRPDRVVVDLPEVNFQIEPATIRLPPKGIGLVKAFRFGLFAPGKSRIVIDLGGPASLRKAVVEPIAGGDPSRLVIDLARTDRASFRAAVRRDQPPAPPVSHAGAVPKPDAKPVVVIDPGHGGIDPGASGIEGVPEKIVVFDFASALAARLTASGRYRVVMTRSDDSFVSLGQRVKIARDAGASLFISVHADTLSDRSVAGTTVYTASDRASDAEAARVAATENRADELAGLEAAPDSQGVNDILFDLTRRETRTYAHLFQRTLVGYWEKIAHLNKNPERAAGFRVLQAPDVPSVLLELGYLSNRADAKMLASPEWRDKATASVMASIDSFFRPREVPTALGTDAATDKIVSAQPHP